MSGRPVKMLTSSLEQNLDYQASILTLKLGALKWILQRFFRQNLVSGDLIDLAPPEYLLIVKIGTLK